jgi:hypothetical protein
MKIISLSSSIAGPACAISCCIKHKFYNNDYITHFFDFLEISLKSVQEIVHLYNQNLDITNELFNNIDIIINKDDKNSVYFKNFNKIISHHDLNKEYTKDDFNNFINKYIRRYYRLIHTIKSENKIFFIRYGYEKEEDINSFINEIKKINNNLIIYFIHLNYNENDNDLNYNINNYYYINFYYLIDYTIKYDEDLFFKTKQFNWYYVYNIINNNLENNEKISYYNL